MTIRRDHLGALALALLLASLAGCSGGAQFGGKKDDKKSDEEEEEEEADEPQQVAGAFLCGFDESDETTALSTPIGCGIFDEADEKIVDDKLKYKLELRDESGEEVPMTSEAAPSDSKWLVLAKLPNAYKQTGRLVLVASPATALEPDDEDVDGSASQGPVWETSIPTSAIGQPAIEQLGGTTNTGMLFHAVWDPGNPSVLGFGIMTTDFCDAAGQIRSELSESSANAGNIAKVNKTIELAPGQLPANACIQDLEAFVNVGTERDYFVHDGQCYFVRANGKLYIASKWLPGNYPALSEQSVDAYTKSRACK